MTLDDLTRWLYLALALTAWTRACTRPSVGAFAAALVATVPLLEDS